MKKHMLLAVVVALVLAGSAWAQVTGLTARSAAMGGAGIAVCDDAIAWAQNPAGLAALNVPVKEGNEYGNDAILLYGQQDDVDLWGVSWSGWNPEEALGFGAGYSHMENGEVNKKYGVGFGCALKNTNLSLGLNIISLDTEGDDATLINAGLLYRWKLSEDKAVRLGLVAMDLANDLANEVIWNAGVAFPINNLLVAVDLIDIGETANEEMLVNGGVEWCPKNYPIKLRVGAMDMGDEHKVTAGLGWSRGPWRIEGAWIDTEPENTWMVQVGVNF